MGIFCNFAFSLNKAEFIYLVSVLEFLVGLIVFHSCIFSLNNVLVNFVANFIKFDSEFLCSSQWLSAQLDGQLMAMSIRLRYFVSLYLLCVNIVCVINLFIIIINNYKTCHENAKEKTTHYTSTHKYFIVYFSYYAGVF